MGMNSLLFRYKAPVERSYFRFVESVELWLNEKSKFYEFFKSLYQFLQLGHMSRIHKVSGHDHNCNRFSNENSIRFWVQRISSMSITLATTDSSTFTVISSTYALLISPKNNFFYRKINEKCSPYLLILTILQDFTITHSILSELLFSIIFKLSLDKKFYIWVTPYILSYQPKITYRV